MPTPPSSPFQRPLRVELEGSQSDLSDTSDEGHSSDLDAEGEDEEDEVMTSDQTDTDDQDEEYQERATSSSRQAGKAAAAAKPKRQTKIKASKKRSGQYKRHLAEKRVQMGEGSIQAHTGRGYTETEVCP
jgi:phosphate starvation-inducible protein PhoH